MKTNFPFTQLCTLAFLTMMTLSSFATEGCTTQQTFGPERTFVDNGVAGQIFTPCQTGDLKFISVYMQSADDLTFGTHLNVFEVDGNNVEKIHTQQVVVPSVSQNPYSKVWLEKDINVDEGKTYAFEVEVPTDREIIFYHTDENKYSAGDFNINGTSISGDMAFEFGINSDKKQLWNIREGSENRVNVTPWLLNLEADYSCLSMQRYYDGVLEVEGSLTQTMTACTDGIIKEMHINGTLIQQGTTGSSITASFTDEQGNIVGESTMNWTQQSEYLLFEFEEIELRGGDQYTMTLAMSDGVVIEFNTIGHQQYFTGALMVNGLHEMKNLCFMGLMDETMTEEEESVLVHEHDDDVDHGGTNGWNHFGADFRLTPPSDIEKLQHTVYPNPFVADFRVEIDTQAEVPGTITLYNFMGKKVFEKNVENISESKFIEINPETVMNKGYYTLRIEYGDNIILDTVVKN